MNRTGCSAVALFAGAVRAVARQGVEAVVRRTVRPALHDVGHGEDAVAGAAGPVVLERCIAGPVDRLGPDGVAGRSPAVQRRGRAAVGVLVGGGVPADRVGAADAPGRPGIVAARRAEAGAFDPVMRGDLAAIAAGVAPGVVDPELREVHPAAGEVGQPAQVELGDQRPAAADADSRAVVVVVGGPAEPKVGVMDGGGHDGGGIETSVDVGAGGQALAALEGDDVRRRGCRRQQDKDDWNERSSYAQRHLPLLRLDGPGCG